VVAVKGEGAIMRHSEAGPEAEKLFRYLVRRAQAADKIAWQQERAHDEIEGWCELCHAACDDECGAWCLFDFPSGGNRDLLFCELSRRTDDDTAFGRSPAQAASNQDE
jgi:hypothetical protein